MTIELRAYQFRNNARSTLQSAISADDTQIVVEEGKGDAFPVLAAGQIFSIILWNTSLSHYEVVYCTARSGDTLTVERAKEGTQSGAFGVGSIVVHNVTAGFYQQIMSPQPTTPVLSGDLVGTEVDLSWTESIPVLPSAVITQYDIYRKVGAGAFAFLASVLAADPREYVDSGLASATTYQYYVVAIASVGPSSANSNTVSRTVATVTYLLFVSHLISATSVDGVVLVSRGALSTDADLKGITYGGGRWLVSGSGNAAQGVVTSDDQGVTWVTRNPGLGQNMEQSAYAFSNFFMGSNNGGVFYSPTGNASSWAIAMSGSRGYGVHYAPATSMLVAVGNLNSAIDIPRVFYSVGSTTLSVGSTTGLPTGSDPGNTLYGIGYDEDRALWYCINGNGKIYSTAEPTAGTWAHVGDLGIAVIGPATFAFKSGGVGQPIVVCSGSHAGIYTSMNEGASFTQYLPGEIPGRVIYSDYFGKFYLAAGDSYSSDDGAVWNAIDTANYVMVGETPA